MPNNTLQVMREYSASFTLALQHQDELQGRVCIASRALQLFPRGPLGLTPDEVKTTEEWKLAYRAYQAAANDLREFNAQFTKIYKRELSQIRKERQAS